MIDGLLVQRRTRTELARRSLKHFFAIYFRDYIRYPSAPFQKEILKLLQNEKIPLLCVVSFRNSGKSTLCSLVYPLWAALSYLQKHHIIIVCQNQARAQEVLANIRNILEHNTLLLNDFGPIQEQNDPNNNNAIVLGRYGVKIAAVSIGEGIRGTIFGAYRPDLIICDDLEDVSSASTKEGRDKIWQLVNSEIIPLRGKDLRLIFVGNLVHAEATMKRLEAKIKTKKMLGVYREYPLLNSHGCSMWPGMFPTSKDIQKFRAMMGSDVDFRREYLLESIPEGGQIILPEWIQYYDDLPTNLELDYHLISVDPAFRDEDGNDFSGIVEADVFDYGKDSKMYIYRHPLNVKLRQPALIEEIKRIYECYSHDVTTNLIVEDAGQQGGFIDALIAEGLPAEGISVISGGRPEGKKIRLRDTSIYIKNGRVLFASDGNEDLITQILYEIDKGHDDLMDAFSQAVKYFVQHINLAEPNVTWLDLDPFIPRGLPGWR